MIGTLESRPPQGISPQDWLHEVRAAWLCLLKLCLQSDPPPSIEDLHRVREDLAAKLRGPDDLETLDWIWVRLERSGGEGARFVREFKSSLRVRSLPRDRMR
jgi:hypothetical protein